MSANINIASLLTIIEDNAQSARMAMANAEVLAANMDLNADKAKAAYQVAIQALLNNTAALHRAFTPPDPATNGRMKLVG